MMQTEEKPPQFRDSSVGAKSSPTLKRYVDKDYAALPPLEVLVYGLFLVGVLARAFYAVFEVSQEYKQALYDFNFEDGWTILGRRDKDIAEFEWTYWRTNFFSPQALLLMFLHAIIGRMFGHFSPKYRTLFLLGFALVSVGLFAGFKLLAFFLFHSILIYAVTCYGNITLVWVTVLVQIATVNFQFFIKFQRYYIFEENEMSLVVFTVAMSTLRHISFASEYWQWHTMPPAKRPEQKQYWGILHYLLYIYYLPLFFSGPLLTYDKFSKQINLRIHLLSLDEWKHILKEFCRYIFWALFMEVVLHFLYFPAFHSRATLLRHLPPLAMGGLALCHLLFFQIKYMVMYGLPRVHAMFDHINAPLPPVCVMGMYLFQDFWRYFDRGLHALMVKCIYIPLGGSRRGIVWQMMASVACFSFVCYWHGTDEHLLYWAVFNSVGVQMEILVSKVAYLSNLNSLLVKHLSPTIYRRFVALILTPNYMCLAFANLVFIGGTRTAYGYYQSLILTGGYTTLVTLLCFYCTIQLIMSLHRKYGKDFMCNKFYYRSW